MRRARCMEASCRARLSEAMELLRTDRLIENELIDPRNGLIVERAGVEFLHATQDLLFADQGPQRNTFLLLQSSYFKCQFSAQVQKVQQCGIDCINFPSPIVYFHVAVAPPRLSRTKKNAAPSFSRFAAGFRNFVRLLVATSFRARLVGPLPPIGEAVRKGER